LPPASSAASARFRSDLGRYQIAVEQQENYVTMVEGGATRSPGTRFVLPLKDQTQRGRAGAVPPLAPRPIIYMLVFNGGKARFVRDGGFLLNAAGNAPYEIPTPFTESDLANLRAVTPSTSADLYAVDGRRFVKLTRNQDTDWTIDEIELSGWPVDTQNLDKDSTIIATAAEGNGIGLTATKAIFTAAHIGRVFRLDDRDLSLTPEWQAEEEQVPSGQQRRWNGNVYRQTNAVTVGKNNPVGAGPNPPLHTEGSVSAGNEKATWEFLHSGYGFVKIKTVGGDGKSATGDVLKRLPDTVVAAAQVGNKTVGGATYRWSAPAWDSDKGFPDTICFDSPRLVVFRGSDFWMSSPIDPEDFTVTGKDDGAIVGRLRSPDGSLVDALWAVAAGPLVVGTSDIEWVLRGASLFEPITGKTLRPFPDGDDGSIPQVPVRVDGGVMFAGKSGKRLHFGAIDANRQGSQRFDSDEVSVFARHIFAPGIKRMAWQRDPHRVLWVVLDDGTLAGVTHMPKQQMLAFHRHPRSNAYFEDIAIIPAAAGGVDEVYFIVRRTIGGQTKRYIEQLGAFFEPEDQDNPTAIGAWFLDCALRYQGAEKKIFTGLEHLAGETVGVFADGAMQSDKTVSATGSVTIDRAAADVLIGIKVRSRILDLPRNITTAEGSTKDKEKAILEGVFDFLYTGGGQVRANEGEYETILETGTKKYGAPIALFSGTKKIPVEMEFALDAQLELVNDDAMPSTVLGMSPRLNVEGD
jgi:hypothetical protein